MASMRSAMDAESVTSFAAVASTDASISLALLPVRLSRSDFVMPVTSSLGGGKPASEDVSASLFASTATVATA